jgi:hypothetical protein
VRRVAEAPRVAAVRVAGEPHVAAAPRAVQAQAAIGPAVQNATGVRAWIQARAVHVAPFAVEHSAQSAAVIPDAPAARFLIPELDAPHSAHRA